MARLGRVRHVQMSAKLSQARHPWGEHLGVAESKKFGIVSRDEELRKPTGARGEVGVENTVRSGADGVRME